MASAPTRHSTPVEHALRDATAIDCSGRCAGRARSQRRIRMQGTDSSALRWAMLPASHPRSGWPYRDACDPGAEAARHRRGGACRLKLASRLSARGPRNGPDAHRMAATLGGAGRSLTAGEGRPQAIPSPPTTRFKQQRHFNSNTALRIWNRLRERTDLHPSPRDSYTHRTLRPAGRPCSSSPAARTTKRSSPRPPTPSIALNNPRIAPSADRAHRHHRIRPARRLRPAA